MIIKEDGFPSSLKTYRLRLQILLFLMFFFKCLFFFFGYLSPVRLVLSIRNSSFSINFIFSSSWITRYYSISSMPHEVRRLRWKGGSIYTPHHSYNTIAVLFLFSLCRKDNYFILKFQFLWIASPVVVYLYFLFASKGIHSSYVTLRVVVALTRVNLNSQ